MTAPELTDRERLAAEHALRLLEGEELVKARGLMATDTAFADEVAVWERNLAPLFDTQPDIVAGPELWARIERQLSENERGNGEVVLLKRQVRNWQVASMVSAAAAIALAFFAAPNLITAPDTQSVEPAPPVAPPLMASVPVADTPLRLAVTYLPDRSELLVSSAGLTADGVHDHELWLIPADGVPRSIGLVTPGVERRVAMPENMAALFSDGAQIAVSREELGGSKPGEGPGEVLGGAVLEKI